jgi:tetratricopeptide (TPR) repeat protein
VFWKRTVEVDPKHANGWVSLGLAYEQLGRLKEAITPIQKAIDISPFHSQAHRDLSRVLEDLDDLEGARSALTKHVEIHPLDGRALGDLGSLLSRMTRYADAIPHLEKAVTLVKDDGWLFARLGVAYLQQKAYANALKALEEAVRVSPTPALWTYAAWNRAEHGQDLDRATELAQKTLARATETMQRIEIDGVGREHFDLAERVGWSWDALGWIHYQNGDLPAAERYVKSAWMLSSEPDVVYHLAQIYEKAGRSTDAATAFLTSVVLPGNPKPEAKQRVKKYFGPGSDMDSAAVGAKALNIQERVVKLPYANPALLEGRFLVLMKPDGTVSDAAFVSGDERLRSQTDVLKKVQFAVRFPDAVVPRLPAHIRVRCGAPDGGCFAFNEPPSRSHHSN